MEGAKISRASLGVIPNLKDLNPFFSSNALETNGSLKEPEPEPESELVERLGLSPELRKIQRCPVRNLHKSLRILANLVRLVLVKNNLHSCEDFP